MPTTDLALLRVEQLHKRFGDHTAVADVTFSVDPAERVALLGPNGAGKTTTLLMLLGAVEPDRGSVRVGGFDIAGDRSRAMEQVGFVAGYLPLPQSLTVFEALDFFASLYGVRRGRTAAIETALERFRIPHLAGQRCESLSSGQRTLVGICKAIVHRPKLVVLDEPTASLDPDVAYRVRTALRELSEVEGMGLLVTSHDMVEVERLCDRVIFIQSGSIVAEGTPDEIARQFDQADLEGVFLQLAGTHDDRRVADDQPTTPEVRP